MRNDGVVKRDWCREMAKRGKSINLFLLDGEANGRIKCTLANWTGVAYKIPRTKLDSCKDRDELKQSGVYFLFGEDNDAGKGVVYVGQAGIRKNGEGILYRLLEHRRNPEKDYWSEAIVLTTSNNSLGPTEISYLENRFCNLAQQADRYEVKNGNDPTHGNITEEKECEMEEFIDCAKVIMGVLGHNLFEAYTPKDAEKTEPSNVRADETIRLYLSRTIGGTDTVTAEGAQIAEGFVVFAGSVISANEDDKVPQVIKEKRKRASIDENRILQEDVLFASPTGAAVFVVGKNGINGLKQWVTKDGRTLKSLEEAE